MKIINMKNLFSEKDKLIILKFGFPYYINNKNAKKSKSYKLKK